MTKLEQEIQEDFNLFYKDKAKYQEKVDGISAKLKFKNEKDKLQSDFLPTYIIGNYKDTSPKYVVISLNPGFSLKWNTEEEKLKNETLENYNNFIINYFDLVQNVKGIKYDSDYYNKLIPIFSKLDGIEISKENSLKYYGKSLINMDIIPYHSHSIKGLCNKELKNYLIGRMNSILEFIEKNINCKMILFHGSNLFEIVKIIYPDITISEINFTEKNKVRFFNLGNLKCAHFRFVGGEFPLKEEQIENLGEIIKQNI